MSLVSVYTFQSYREFLKASFEAARTKNKSLSQRYFAGKLGMSSSFLTEVLKGKKNLSPDKAHHIAEFFKLSKKEKSYFLKLVELETIVDEDLRLDVEKSLEALRPPTKRQSGNIKELDMLEAWFFIPLMEMATSSHYRQNIVLMAQDLGVSPVQVGSAIAFMVEHGILKNNDGVLVKNSLDLIYSSAVHSTTLKRFHNQMLDKAQRAIYDQTPQERYTGTETLMIDPEQIPEAHRIINDCLDQLLNLLQRGQNRTEPYHIAVNMFSLKRKKMRNAI